MTDEQISELNLVMKKDNEVFDKQSILIEEFSENIINKKDNEYTAHINLNKVDNHYESIKSRCLVYNKKQNRLNNKQNVFVA